MMKKFLVLSLVLLFTINIATASIIGVNRAQLNFDDVLRNGYAEEEFVISIGTEFDVEVSYEVRGDIADWFRFEPTAGSVTVNENTPQTITVIVEPPSDAQVGSYEARIVVLTSPLNNAQTAMGSSVVASFEMRVFVNVTDTQILRCVMGGVNLQDTEVGFPSEFSASITNRGNVRIRPQFTIEVFDQFEENLVETTSLTYTRDVLPTATQRTTLSFQPNLPPGQYWARIQEDFCEGSSYLTFEVLERGGIRDDGELVRISNNAWADVGEIVPITAQFRNQGERVVDAQFKGVIVKGDRIIQIIESDLTAVSPGELVDISMFFVPDEPGQYEVKGRMHYNNKLTFERGSVINVNNQGTITSRINFLLIVFYSTIFAIIVVIILIFRKSLKK